MYLFSTINYDIEPTRTRENIVSPEAGVKLLKKLDQFVGSMVGKDLSYVLEQVVNDWITWLKATHIIRSYMNPAIIRSVQVNLGGINIKWNDQEFFSVFGSTPSDFFAMARTLMNKGVEEIAFRELEQENSALKEKIESLQKELEDNGFVVSLRKRVFEFSLR